MSENKDLDSLEGNRLFGRKEVVNHMPFADANINQVIETKRNADADFKRAWDDSLEEYRLIGEMISLREEEKMTQGKLAEL